MAQYDPKIIHEFADRLYREADRIIMVYTVIGALIGGILAVTFDGIVGGIIGGKILGLVIFGAIGYYFGREKAFSLKLQAQTVLCQVKIEENTGKQQG